MMKRMRQQQGFTIIELMIALTVFTVVLLICSFAIIHVGRMYYRGTLINRTQETARRVSDDLTMAVQFGSKGNDFYKESAEVLINNVYVKAKCYGDVRYTYATRTSLGTKTGQSRHVLWKDRKTVPGCEAFDINVETPSPGGQELLSKNMRLPQFDTSPIGNVWDVKVRVAYGDEDDLFEDTTYAVCRGTEAGGQFCAVSQLDTYAVKRL